MTTTATLFGPFSPDLTPGARNAIEVCLAIRQGERVALIADEASYTCSGRKRASEQAHRRA